MFNILFVGERRSEKAKTLGLRWENGGLAAKPLFEALEAIGIKPQECRFTNWFEGGKTVTRKHRGIIVAMGNKVQNALTAEGIAFISIVHPAARGLIRRRDRYLAHVAERLGALSS
jgi:hypothetical protein